MGEEEEASDKDAADAIFNNAIDQFFYFSS